MVQKEVGIRIKNLRKQHHLTQEQLAEKLNISNKAISKWERGRGLPDISLLTDLCKTLNVSLDELFDGEKYSAARVIKNETEDNANRLNALEPDYSGLRIMHERFGPGIIIGKNEVQLENNYLTLWKVKYDNNTEKLTGLPDMMAVGNIVPEREEDKDYIEKSKVMMRLGIMLFRLDHYFV